MSGESAIINPMFKEGITFSEILSTEGTFYIVIKANGSEIGFFGIRNDDFEFSFGIFSNCLVFKRHDREFKLDISEVLNSDRVINDPEIYIFVGISWSINSINLFCGNKGEGGSLSKEYKTSPVIPPVSLLKWARQECLINTKEYINEEHFRRTIHTTIENIQIKINQHASYNSFWNLEYEGNKIISRTPKKETDIQPLISALISDQSIISSFEIIPEYTTGVGNVDMLFIGKLQNKKSVYIALEVKNAHSNDLDKGLQSQLPKYMVNKECNYGVYLVLNYFGKYLEMPNKYDGNLLSYLDKVKLKLPTPYNRSIKVFDLKLTKPDTASL